MSGAPSDAFLWENREYIAEESHVKFNNAKMFDKKNCTTKIT